MNISFAATTHSTAARGFTLIELMVTVSVAGILAAIAVPAFNSFMLNDRQIGQANSLVSSFNYARSEAIKRDVTGGITVCPSVNGTSCTGASDWQDGWIVYWPLDPNPANEPLQRVPAMSGTNSFTPSNPAVTSVVFLSSGMVASALSITICDNRGASYAHDVEVNAAGRVAASQTPGKSVSLAALACP
ncbi:MAG TPA: GspH/FimT family pseudopilin [Steroidobacteraceae bacterium]|nr:GspH/FimT family pseudopilin [Steroidobacteraceae bacterium]